MANFTPTIKVAPLPPTPVIVSDSFNSLVNPLPFGAVLVLTQGAAPIPQITSGQGWPLGA